METLLAIFAGVGIAVFFLVLGAAVTGMVEEVRYRLWLRRYQSSCGCDICQGRRKA